LPETQELTVILQRREWLATLPVEEEEKKKEEEGNKEEEKRKKNCYEHTAMDSLET
jgi:hypothetical protein